MNKLLRRGLGILDLGGSFLGLVLGLTLFLQHPSLLTILLEIPFLALYCWGVWCGVRTLENHPKALRANLWLWLIQIPFLKSYFFTYWFTSGALLFVTYAPAGENVSFMARVGSEFQYSFLQPQPFQVGANLLAVAICIVLLWRGRHKRRELHEAHLNVAMDPE